jgi:integrase
MGMQEAERHASPVLPNRAAMKLKLDNKVINALVLAKGRSEDFAWDAELENFGLRLRRGADGVRRTYVVQYRAHGRTRRHTVGSADKLSLAQARAAAKRILARVALGHDPQAERDAKRVQAARSFSAVAAAYMATKAEQWRSGSVRTNRLYLTGPYFRPLHNVAISEISRADLAARLGTIRRDHSPATLVAAHSCISAMFAWAVTEALIEANPIIGLAKPPTLAARDHVITLTELVAIWRACGDDEYGCIIKLLILLASRRAEVGSLKWSKLDLTPGAGIWRLPGERSKNRRPTSIVLPSAAIAILNSVPRRAGRDYLFGDGAAGFTAWSRPKRLLDQRLADSVRPWRLHDLRRAAASHWGDVLGAAPHVIELALNHVAHRSGISGTYNRAIYSREVATLLQKWSDHITSLVTEPASKIVTLRA